MQKQGLERKFNLYQLDEDTNCSVEKVKKII